MTQITTRRQLLDELDSIRSRHLLQLNKVATKHDALFHQGVITIISYSLAAVKRRKLRSVIFGWHQFCGSRELRRELEARQDRANQARAWCIARGYWTLAQQHAGEALACGTLVRMMGGKA